MILCKQCQHGNNDHADFCLQCGQPLKAVNWCASCQLDNPFGLDECFSCNAPLDGEATILGEIVADEPTEDDSIGDNWLDQIQDDADLGSEEDLFAEGDDWLNELDSGDAISEDSLRTDNDWLGQSEDETDSGEDLFVEGDDWLNELGGGKSDQVEAADSLMADDWLDQIEDEGLAEETDVPDWMVVDEDSAEDSSVTIDEESGLIMEDLSNVRSTTMDTSILKENWDLEEVEDHSTGYGDLLGDDSWLSEQLEEMEADDSAFDDDDDDDFVIEHTGWLTGRLGTDDLEEDYFGDGTLDDLVEELGTGELLGSLDEEFGEELGDEFFAEEEEDIAYSPGTGPLPDWLVELKTGPLPSLDERAMDDLQYGGEQILPETGDLPDWLVEMDTSSLPPLPGEKKGSNAKEAANDLDWLDDISAEASVSNDLDLNDDLMPDWLADAMPSSEGDADSLGIDPLAGLLEEPAVAIGDLDDIGFDQDVDLPDWLNSGDNFDFDSALDAALAVQKQENDDSWGNDWTDLPDPSEVGDIDLDLGDLPDWLESARPDGVEFEEEGYEDLDFSEEEEELAMPTMISESEIPEWISALKPRELTGEPEPEAEPEPIEEEGPLAGLRGVLQIATAVTMARSIAGKTAVEAIVTDSSTQVALLKKLAHEHERQGYTIDKRSLHQVSKTFRLILATTLFAIIIALWWDLYPVNFAWGAAAPELTNMKTAVAQISGESVIVAFDYTPAFAGELDLTAELMLHELAQNGNRIIPISRYATGVGNAQRLINKKEYQNVADPLLIVGNGIGLRQFSACLEGIDCFWSFGTIAEDVALEIADASLIIVLTSDRDVVVDWVEQIGATTEIPIYMGVTESLSPIISPYLASNQIEGALAGMNGLMNYEKHPSRKLLVRANIQAVLQWFLILFLPTSNLITLFWANWQKTKQQKIRKIPQASNPWRMAKSEIEEIEEPEEALGELIYDDESEELE